MLFLVKRTLKGTLILTFILMVTSLLLGNVLDLPWQMTLQPGDWRNIAIGTVAVLIGNGVVNGLLRLIYREDFDAKFEEFMLNVVVGESDVVLIVGLTAACEVMFFRGVIMELIYGAGGTAVVAVLVSIFISGLAHAYQSNSGNRLFFLTNVIEGVVLAITYALTRSLVVTMLIHAFTDVILGAAAIIMVRQMKES